MPRRPSTSGEVLRLIREEGVSTRAELGRLTGLSRPAVTLRVTELIAHGLVTECAAGPSTGGRPPARLDFNAAGGAVLVASLGRSRGQVGVCDLAGELIVQTPLELDGSGADTLPRLLDRGEELLAKAGIDRSKVRGVGIGIPGPVEFAAGRPEVPPAPPIWGEAPIRPLVAERFAVPVHLDNDVNLAALGEHRLRQHGHCDDLLFVKLSTGIGAGVIAGGRIQRGALGAAGEIGHIPVRDGGSAPCSCGNLGCVETVAGGTALLARLAEMGRPCEDLAALARLAENGDAEVVALVREAGRRVGEVIAAAVNLLNPGVVVLGGDLARAYEPLIAGVREIVYQRATALATRQLRIEPSLLGDTAGLAGCAAMVLDHILAPDAIDAVLPS
ncbi:sugar kinase [Actinomadura craniellae]|uniref:Sugar kinase n=1 Tax=Actinomadura craniellae TaxID=2231787 RepID=A0A365H0A4_9ACTN|nr:ROK family transcriptional regulator [Actinomadura craniellae]RAY11633.1 sugar kinase [Actinomadura craniellae]